jgi:hypothetical protein
VVDGIPDRIGIQDWDGRPYTADGDAAITLASSDQWRMNVRDAWDWMVDSLQSKQKKKLRTDDRRNSVAATCQVLFESDKLIRSEYG